MFLPNTFGMLSPHIGKNVYGEPLFGAPKKVACAVVHAKSIRQRTAIRTDSSASRANAEELISKTHILFPANVSIGIDDRFQIDGLTLRAGAIESRHSVFGEIDHYEVEFEILV